ncbi:hypothetical protein CH378_13730 [Leptospira kmetyi]|uniref:Tetratricopeptide repeat protein n=3 Tax=Leptospira kmetyi TaxID=408139 RepID=A0ABX4N786_9LEPT|nr:hypothetical protein CH378_13730 [Leptospira kmetyi]
MCSLLKSHTKARFQKKIFRNKKSGNFSKSFGYSFNRSTTMSLNRIFPLFLVCFAGFFLNCAVLFPMKASERWTKSVQAMERSEGQERIAAEREWIENLETFRNEDSPELKESLRNFILAETASKFNSYIQQKQWSSAALIAKLYSETIPFLGIGDSAIQGTKTGNLYSSREYFTADLIAYTSASKDFQFLPLIQKMIPNPIGDARLAFNLACLHALQGNKQEMLQYMKMAFFLGKQTVDFEKDEDFNSFRSDPDFIRMIWDGPALDSSLIPPSSKPSVSPRRR